MDKQTAFFVALLFGTGETAHLLLHDLDVPKQFHTEHQHYSAPEKPITTVIGSGGVVITVPTATTTMSAFAPVVN